VFNLKKIFSLSIFFLVIHPFLFAEEQLTITTYYPSPAGSYFNLYVLNSLGIGTTAPRTKLEVAGATPTNTSLATRASGSYIKDTYGSSLAATSPNTINHASIIGDTVNAGAAIYTYGALGGYDENGWFGIAGYTQSGAAVRGSVLNSGSGYAGIFTGGNVGIGTTGPGYKLDVNGSMRWGGSSAPCIYTNEDGSGLYLEQVGTATANSKIRLQSSVNGGQSQYAQFFVDPANGFSFVSNGTANGNVGIGTTGPSNLLHIMGNNDNNGNYYSQIRVDGTGAYPLNIAGISLNPGGAGIQSHIRFLENGTPKVQIRFNNGSTTDNKLKIYSWTTGTDFVTFDAGSGYVGIGTTVPGADLDVWAANPVLRVSTSYASSPYTAAIDLGYQSNATSKLRVAYKADTAETFIDNVYQTTVSGQPYGDINLRTYPSGGNAPVPAIIIKGYTGYVGIGSTSPTSKLVVKSAGAGYNAGLFLGGTTCFSILPHNGVVYLSAGTNYEASVWNYTYHSGLGASLLAINETTGVNWYSGTGDSYSNVASNVQLWTAAGVWVGSSSRKLKENFTQLNPDDILQKIDQLDVSRWNFKSEGKPITHIGPVAEEFYRIFKTGDSEEKLATIDSVGVSLAGVKALSQKIKTQQQQIEKLQQEIEGLKSGFQGLKSKL
jgi:hypothetical protein